MFNAIMKRLFPPHVTDEKYENIDKLIIQAHQAAVRNTKDKINADIIALLEAKYKILTTADADIVGQICQIVDDRMEELC
tara:strand:+ start:1090 stop:1329 length:240 start_codon:yes stop_codon:yes gene_type:complete